MSLSLRRVHALIGFFSIFISTTIFSADFESEYNIEPFLQMCERQRSFFVTTWKIDDVRVNPSMIRDPENDNKSVIVWRLPDKGRHDKIGYMWMDSRTWKSTKNTDLVGTDTHIIS
jgi:hypothetical protein